MLQQLCHLSLILNYDLRMITKLNQHVFYSFKLTVRATDQSSQPKTATASVFITITRNQFSPEISPKLLTADIETTYPLMTPIVQFTVSDKDRIINGNVSSRLFTPF